MGEVCTDAFRVGFDASIKLQFRGAHVTGGAGLLAFRELDDALGLTDLAGRFLVDPRRGRDTRHSLIGQLRQSVYGRLAGYDDTNDADRLCEDPAMRLIVRAHARSTTAASASQMGRFETEILTQAENQHALLDLPGHWIDQASKRKAVSTVLLNLDSSVSPTHEHQEGSAFNGHFDRTCYHPLFCFNQHGDLERALLRKGNAHTADDWKSVLGPVLVRYRKPGVKIFFRGDAGFAAPEIYLALEGAEVQYAIRVKDNSMLERHIEHPMIRPVFAANERADVRYHEFEYQAASGTKARHIVAKVTWFPERLLPAIGFIVTNLNWAPRRVTHFYNQRGTAEQWIKEGKYALNWIRLSCHGFAENQARLQLFALAYNLGNFLRRLALPRRIAQRSLRTVQQRLIKIGARAVRHAGYLCFQLAEAGLPRQAFAEILARIHNLPAAVPT
jgi:hypothetical protein